MVPLISTIGTPYNPQSVPLSESNGPLPSRGNNNRKAEWLGKALWIQVLAIALVGAASVASLISDPGVSPKERRPIDVVVTVQPADFQRQLPVAGPTPTSQSPGS